MILNIAEFFENELKKELKVAHLDKKIDCKVVEAAKVNKKMKEAIGKEEMKNGDILIGLVEMNQQPIDQTDASDDKSSDDTSDAASSEDAENDVATDNADASSEKEDTAASDDGSEENKDDASSEKEDTGSEDNAASEDSDSEEEDDKKKKKDDEELNESVKITDLTSKMCSQIKPSKVKVVPQKKSCVKEGETPIKKAPKKPKVKPAAMPLGPVDKDGVDHGTPYAGSDAGGDTVGDAGGIAEAETEATGEELKVKTLKCLQKLTKEQETDSNKIEIKEVPGMKGVYYAMIKFGTVGIDQTEKED